MLQEQEIKGIVKQLSKHSEDIEFGELTVRLVIHNGRVTVQEYTTMHKERRKVE